MKPIFSIILAFNCTMFSLVAERYLSDATKTEGYLARVLINEIPFPGEPSYQSELDSKSAMCSILYVLDSRINQIPNGYSREEIANTYSKKLIDIITAGGKRGQIDGFYKNKDQLMMAPRVTKRINNLIRIANKGKPGRFSKLLKYAQKISSEYVNKQKLPRSDLYKKIEKIPPKKVTGRAYGWMTDRDYYKPGGSYVRIPNKLRGSLGGNRFYTLETRFVKRRKSSNNPSSPTPKKETKDAKK